MNDLAVIHISKNDFFVVDKHREAEVRERAPFLRTIKGHVTYNRANKKRHLTRLINHTPEGLETDHINRDLRDYTERNLRSCTNAQNQINRKKPAGGTSQFKGVHRNKLRHKWEVGVRHNGKRIYGGLFNDEVEAAKAYDKIVKELYGSFACLNFPDALAQAMS